MQVLCEGCSRQGVRYFPWRTVCNGMRATSNWSHPSISASLWPSSLQRQFQRQNKAWWRIFSSHPKSIHTDAEDVDSEEFTDFGSGDESDEMPTFESGEPILNDLKDGPGINTGTTEWGVKALELARKILSGPQMEGLDLFAFNAMPKQSLLDIQLDKVDDKYGSPTIDEITEFSREFQSQLEEELGEEEAGHISVEVSSPGAERQVRIPEDLNRFKDLPMSVRFAWTEDGQEKKDTQVLQVLLDETNEETSMWQLANVKRNRLPKRQTLTKKQQARRFSIPVSSIARVNLYIDF